MKLKQLSLLNFRNYQNLLLDFNEEKIFNLIISPNGMGKSNLLESIYYLSHIRSFRNVKDNEIIKKGEKNFKIECNYQNNSSINNILINYTNKKKEVHFNNKSIKKYSDMLGKFLTVFFGNEDIFIINGSPNIRRKFFDIFFSIIDKNYLFYLIEYQKIIKQKNFLLKNKDNNNLINVYNKQLCNSIQYIQEKRCFYINKISGMFLNLFNDIGNFNEKIQLKYKSIIQCQNSLSDIYNFLENNIHVEKKIGYSIYGIHRDIYYFLINDITFDKYASFGQTRLAALIIKLIQSEIYKQIFNITPILLLDDVILELDKNKQLNFLNKLQGNNQIFITITDKKNIGLIDNYNIINEIEILNGKIK